MGVINELKFNKQGLKSDFKKDKAFTLIEVMVVIAAIGIVLPALFSIIFTILQQQIKIQRLSIVKREGDYVINLLENIIRNNAVKIYSDQTLNNEQCTTENPSYGPQNGQNFYFRDKFDRWFKFYQDSTNLASNSANLSLPINLNSQQTKITSFSIECYRTALYSPAVVGITFTIEYNTASSRPEEKVTPLTYKTKIKLRNY